MRPFGVIFDMDGVLVDSNEAHYQTFQRLGKELGKPYPRELWAQTIGMHNSQIFPMWLGPLPPGRVRELADYKEAMYRDMAGPHLKAIPGAVELVKRLSGEGIPIAVGSSGPRANVALALQRLELETYFKTVITGDDVRHGKPAPDIFLAAAEGLAFEVSRCVVIEDAPQGIQAALAARMAVVGVTTSAPAAMLSAATLVVESLTHLDSARLAGLIG